MLMFRCLALCRQCFIGTRVVDECWSLDREFCEGRPCYRFTHDWIVRLDPLIAKIGNQNPFVKRSVSRFAFFVVTVRMDDCCLSRSTNTTLHVTTQSELIHKHVSK